MRLDHALDDIDRGATWLDEQAAKRGAVAKVAPWSEPQDLIEQAKAEPYPLDALPGAIRAAVAEVMGFVKAPTVLVASSALAALSVAAQAYADVKRADKLTGPCGLFLLTIADSGERKSTCDGFFTAPIRDYQEAQAETAKPLLAAYKADCESWEARRAGMKDAIRTKAKASQPTSDLEAAMRRLEGEKPEAPKVPRLLYGDTTPEALAFSLAKDWPAGGIVSAEAGLVFGAHAMGRESAMRNMGLLNTLWDGVPLAISRKTSESFTVNGARLTIALQVQGETLRAFFTQSGPLARGIGFLARFLIACPQSTQGFRPFTEAPAHWPALAVFHRRISAILDQAPPLSGKGGLVPPLLSLSPEAKAAWVVFHDAIEGELAASGELYDVRDVAAKTADNAARLAALFHLFAGGLGAITPEAFTSASQIVAWHLHEAQRFFSEIALPPELTNAIRLDTWLIEYCRRERAPTVPIAKLQQCGPSGLRNKGAIETAMTELDHLGRARWERDGKRKLIAVNPALLKGGGL